MMKSDIWQRLCEGQKIYVPEDFESAALRLITEQVLYGADLHSRVAYGLVTTYERSFSEVLDLLGIELKVRPEKRYVCAIPRNRSKAPFPRATLEETLFALVLRKVYDTHIMAADIQDNGEVDCHIEEFAEAYKAATNRESPSSVGTLRALLRVAARWGLAREGEPEDDGQPFTIIIRPAIVDLLGETALHRLAAHFKSQGAVEPAPENSTEAQ